MKCITCGKEETLNKNGECFECSLWGERLPLVGKSTTAIIDGTFYSIGPEDDTPKDLRGFGGDKFVIHFKDGREVITTNLWCGGEISKHWKPKFPDNADFDWKWKKIGNNNYLVPKENEG